MGRPRVLLTPWRRTLPTALDPECDLLTIAPDYTDAVRRAGGLPIVAAHVEGEEIDELLDAVDALLLTGGQDVDPELYGQAKTSSWRVARVADDFDVALARAAIARGLPVLGVCRGAQVLNVALGGDLRQEIQQQGGGPHPTYREMGPDPRSHRHDVVVRSGTRLAALYAEGPLVVNSLHHQAIGALAPGLVVSAVAPDGVVEAIEGESIDVLAVQWHPEMLRNEGGDVLFTDLVARARMSATMTT
ncbi:MAG: gamma-glutamyl-gamma-aminobutyrate hydrolase family protein [Acidimicrobiales bacterium]